MKRVIKLTSILLCFLIIIIGLSSCKKEKFDIEYNNDVFFNAYTSHYNDGITIDELSIYYYESYFYYDVVGTDYEENKSYHFLYVIRYKQLQIWYSILHPEKDIDYYPNSYFNYLTSKEEGVSKTYTKEEINDLINSYYGIYSK